MDAARAHRSDVAPDVLPDQQHLTEEESPRRTTFSHQGAIPDVAQPSDVEGLSASQLGYEYPDGSREVCGRTDYPPNEYECRRTPPSASERAYGR